MEYLKFCSYCGAQNVYEYIDGNYRYHCTHCDTIHYENPKPTATLVCPKKEEILLVKRAVEPGMGLWGLPGGYIEKGESPETAAVRELREETRLAGRVVKTLGTCSHFNTILGDILLIGLEVEVKGWSIMEAGDDAVSAGLFSLNELPKLAFICHEKIVNMYREQFK